MWGVIQRLIAFFGSAKGSAAGKMLWAVVASAAAGLTLFRSGGSQSDAGKGVPSLYKLLKKKLDTPAFADLPAQEILQVSRMKDPVSRSAGFVDSSVEEGPRSLIHHPARLSQDFDASIEAKLLVEVGTLDPAFALPALGLGLAYGAAKAIPAALSYFSPSAEGAVAGGGQGPGEATLEEEPDPDASDAEGSLDLVGVEGLVVLEPDVEAVEGTDEGVEVKAPDETIGGDAALEETKPIEEEEVGEFVEGPKEETKSSGAAESAGGDVASNLEAKEEEESGDLDEGLGEVDEEEKTPVSEQDKVEFEDVVGGSDVEEGESKPTEDNVDEDVEEPVDLGEDLEKPKEEDYEPKTEKDDFEGDDGRKEEPQEEEIEEGANVKDSEDAEDILGETKPAKEEVETEDVVEGGDVELEEPKSTDEETVDASAEDAVDLGEDLEKPKEKDESHESGEEEVLDEDTAVLDETESVDDEVDSKSQEVGEDVEAASSTEGDSVKESKEGDKVDEPEEDGLDERDDASGAVEPKDEAQVEDVVEGGDVELEEPKSTDEEAVDSSAEEAGELDEDLEKPKEEDEPHEPEEKDDSKKDDAEEEVDETVEELSGLGEVLDEVKEEEEASVVEEEKVDVGGGRVEEQGDAGLVEGGEEVDSDFGDAKPSGEEVEGAISEAIEEADTLDEKLEEEAGEILEPLAEGDLKGTSPVFDFISFLDEQFKAEGIEGEGSTSLKDRVSSLWEKTKETGSGARNATELWLKEHGIAGEDAKGLNELTVEQLQSLQSWGKEHGFNQENLDWVKDLSGEQAEKLGDWFKSKGVTQENYNWLKGKGSEYTGKVTDFGKGLWTKYGWGGSEAVEEGSLEGTSPAEVSSLIELLDEQCKAEGIEGEGSTSLKDRVSSLWEKTKETGGGARNATELWLKEHGIAGEDAKGLNELTVEQLQSLQSWGKEHGFNQENLDWVKDLSGEQAEKLGDWFKSKGVTQENYNWLKGKGSEKLSEYTGKVTDFGKGLWTKYGWGGNEAVEEGSLEGTSPAEVFDLIELLDGECKAEGIEGEGSTSLKDRFSSLWEKTKETGGGARNATELWLEEHGIAGEDAKGLNELTVEQLQSLQSWGKEHGFNQENLDWVKDLSGEQAEKLGDWFKSKGVTQENYNWLKGKGSEYTGKVTDFGKGLWTKYGWGGSEAVEEGSLEGTSPAEVSSLIELLDEQCKAEGIEGEGSTSLKDRVSSLWEKTKETGGGARNATELWLKEHGIAGEDAKGLNELTVEQLQSLQAWGKEHGFNQENLDWVKDLSGEQAEKLGDWFKSKGVTQENYNWLKGKGSEKLSEYTGKVTDLSKDLWTKYGWGGSEAVEEGSLEGTSPAEVFDLIELLDGECKAKGLNELTVEQLQSLQSWGKEHGFNQENLDWVKDLSGEQAEKLGDWFKSKGVTQENYNWLKGKGSEYTGKVTDFGKGLWTKYGWGGSEAVEEGSLEGTSPAEVFDLIEFLDEQCKAEGIEGEGSTSLKDRVSSLWEKTKETGGGARNATELWLKEHGIAGEDAKGLNELTVEQLQSLQSWGKEHGFNQENLDWVKDLSGEKAEKLGDWFKSKGVTQENYNWLKGKGSEYTGKVTDFGKGLWTKYGWGGSEAVEEGSLEGTSPAEVFDLIEFLTEQCKAEGIEGEGSTSLKDRFSSLWERTKATGSEVTGFGKGLLGQYFSGSDDPVEEGWGSGRSSPDEVTVHDIEEKLFHEVSDNVLIRDDMKLHSLSSMEKGLLATLYNALQTKGHLSDQDSANITYKVFADLKSSEQPILHKVRSGDFLRIVQYFSGGVLFESNAIESKTYGEFIVSAKDYLGLDLERVDSFKDHLGSITSKYTLSLSDWAHSGWMRSDLKEWAQENGIQNDAIDVFLNEYIRDKGGDYDDLFVNDLVDVSVAVQVKASSYQKPIGLIHEIINPETRLEKLNRLQKDVESFFKDPDVQVKIANLAAKPLVMYAWGKTGYSPKQLVPVKYLGSGLNSVSSYLIGQHIIVPVAHFVITYADTWVSYYLGVQSVLGTTVDWAVWTASWPIGAAYYGLSEGFDLTGTILSEMYTVFYPVGCWVSDNVPDMTRWTLDQLEDLGLELGDGALGLLNLGNNWVLQPYLKWVNDFSWSDWWDDYWGPKVEALEQIYDAVGSPLVKLGGFMLQGLLTEAYFAGVGIKNTVEDIYGWATDVDGWVDWWNQPGVDWDPFIGVAKVMALPVTMPVGWAWDTVVSPLASWVYNDIAQDLSDISWFLGESYNWATDVEGWIDWWNQPGVDWAAVGENILWAAQPITVPAGWVWDNIGEPIAGGVVEFGDFMLQGTLNELYFAGVGIKNTAEDIYDWATDVDGWIDWWNQPGVDWDPYIGIAKVMALPVTVPGGWVWDTVGEPIAGGIYDYGLKPAYDWVTDVEGWADWWNQPGVDWGALGSEIVDWGLWGATPITWTAQTAWHYVGEPIAGGIYDYGLKPAYDWVTDVEGWADWWNQPGVDWGALGSEIVDWGLWGATPITWTAQTAWHYVGEPIAGGIYDYGLKPAYDWVTDVEGWADWWNQPGVDWGALGSEIVDWGLWGATPITWTAQTAWHYVGEPIAGGIYDYGLKPAYDWVTDVEGWADWWNQPGVDWGALGSEIVDWGLWGATPITWTAQTAWHYVGEPIAGGIYDYGLKPAYDWVTDVEGWADWWNQPGVDWGALGSEIVDWGLWGATPITWTAQTVWDNVGEPIVGGAYDWVTDVDGWVDWWNQPGVDWYELGSEVLGPVKHGTKYVLDNFNKEILEGLGGAAQEYALGFFTGAITSNPVVDTLLFLGTKFGTPWVVQKTVKTVSPPLYEMIFSEDPVDDLKLSDSLLNEDVELDPADQVLVDQLLGETHASDLNVDPNGPLFGVDHVDPVEAYHEGIIEGQIDAEFIGSGHSDEYVGDIEDLLPNFHQFAEQQNVGDFGHHNLGDIDGS